MSSPDSSGPAAALARGAERRLLFAACLATTLVPLSSTMVAVALPDLRSDFDLSVAAAVWLVNAYLVVTAAAQLVAGGLGDRLGRRRLAIVGVAGFGVCSALAAAAPAYPTAIAARCLQAVFGALAIVNVAAAVRTAVPAVRRGRAFGMVGAAATLAAASGPLVGEVAVRWAGWQGTFLIVLPLVAAALTAVVCWLPADGAVEGPKRFDPFGAVLLLATLACAAVLVNRLSEDTPLVVGVALAAGTVLAGLAFVLVERRHPAPVLTLSVLKVRALAASVVAIACGNLAMYLVLLAIPLVVVDHAAGVILAPMLAGAAVLAPVGGALADRWGRRAPAIAGNLLIAAAFAALIPLDLTERPVLTGLLLGAAGLGMGLSTAAVQTAGAEALPPAQAGLAAGVSSSARYLGSILGTSLLAVLVSNGNGERVFAVAGASAGIAAAASLWIVASGGSRLRGASTAPRAPAGRDAPAGPAR
ncbi:MAG: MFS transporter [Sporichthyaceae bacterium]